MRGVLAHKRPARARPAYVGDTQGDSDSAAKAGMDFVFARYGFGQVDECALSFDSFPDLVAHFADSARCHGPACRLGAPSQAITSRYSSTA